jgi:hypothetical protein
MPPRTGSGLGNIIKHAGYSVAPTHRFDTTYKGRSRINSRSSKFQGGVFCPHILQGTMEAIVVDYEEDKFLAQYIHHIEQYASAIMQQLKTSGRSPKFDDLAAIIARKIQTDFPYSHRMLDENYLNQSYPPGKKFHLGVMMQKQDMICRHMGLLFAITIEHLRDKGYAQLRVRSDTDIRFVTDMQSDPRERDTSGHGYVVMKRSEKGHVQYFVADPTGGRVFDIREGFDRPGEKSPTTYRYLFSVIRFVFQGQDLQNNSFKHWLTRLRKADSQVQRILEDVERAYAKSGDITGIQNIRGYLAKGV